MISESAKQMLAILCDADANLDDDFYRKNWNIFDLVEFYNKNN